MKSYDSRYKDAAGDIYQHRINNNDWSDDWIFSDGRFELAKSDEKFLRFLAETVHPVVRRNPGDSAALVDELNRYLARDGWELAESERISGRPCYAAQRIHSGVVRSVRRARAVADVLDAAWMRGEITRLEQAVERDPSLAIGTAKELVETCCKTILSRRGKDVPKGIDLPKLVKETAAELQLVADGVSQTAKGAESIKLVLRSLGTITQGLAELRGLYGTGHGRDGGYRGLSPRHARLAVASAVAFVDFVTETYRERERGENKTVMMDNIYSELKGWQTAIGAVLGFCALMFGALWNFHLNRRRDRRLRHEETITVATALYGEIILLRQEVSRIGNMVAGRYEHWGFRGGEIFDKHFVEDHKLPDGFIYQALADKIGMLAPDTIVSIAEFHQNLQKVRSWLPRLAEDKSRPYTYGVLYVLHPARDAVKKIEPTLRYIEEMANLREATDTPDISKMEDVIDLEESTHSDHD
jgi:hypothetical protein